MIVFKIAGIILIVFAVLFLLSIIIYMFNLDMKLASKIGPVMNKIYDRGRKKRHKAKLNTDNKGK